MIIQSQFYVYHVHYKCSSGLLPFTLFYFIVGMITEIGLSSYVDNDIDIWSDKEPSNIEYVAVL